MKKGVKDDYDFGRGNVRARTAILGKIVGGAGLGGRIRNLVLDTFSLRTLGSIQVDMLN